MWITIKNSSISWGLKVFKKLWYKQINLWVIRNYLLIIKINLDINNLLVFKIIFNLVNIVTNYFLSIKLVFI